jgi:hypothetical protein
VTKSVQRLGLRKGKLRPLDVDAVKCYGSSPTKA